MIKTASLGSSLAELCFFLIPPREKRKIMAILGGYFDDTATHSGELIAFAGCVASSTKWKSFEKQWNNILKDAGLAKNKPFHMKDFVNYKDIYEKWPKKKHDKVLKSLVSEINNHAMMVVIAGVLTRDYKRFSRDVSPPLGDLKSPYSYCAYECFAQIARWIRKDKIKDNIAYIFEAGGQAKGEILNIRDTIMDCAVNKDIFKMVSCTFADKTKFRSLQAADLIAWEAQRYFHAHYYNGDPIKKWRKSFQELFNKTAFLHELIDYDGLMRARKYKLPWVKS